MNDATNSMKDENVACESQSPYSAPTQTAPSEVEIEAAKQVFSGDGAVASCLNNVRTAKEWRA
jgi:hypothetical protein